jgi:hypothetical protein
MIISPAQYAETWVFLRDHEKLTEIPARDDPALGDKFMAVADFEAEALNDVDMAWDAIVEAWKRLRAKDPETIAYFAAGLLENLVVNRFDLVFPKIKALLAQDPDFETALSNVWPQDLAEAKWLQLQGLLRRPRGD